MKKVSNIVDFHLTIVANLMKIKKSKCLAYILGFICSGLILLILNCINYFSAINYDPKSDYEYNIIKNDKINSYVVTIKNGYFAWPYIHSKWDTALLKIRTKSGLLSIFYEPNIEVSAKNIKWEQYFERRAAGIRYLNLSNLTGINLKPGDLVRLSGNNISCEEGKSELYLFDNSYLDKSSVLIFAPHPDDAELGAFGFYSANSKSTHIVTVTVGDAGADYFPGVLDIRDSYELKAKLRAIDSISVPLIGGVEFNRCINLGYFDSKLEEMYNRKDHVAESRYTKRSTVNEDRYDASRYAIGKHTISARWNNLVDDIAAIIKHVKPTLIITPHVFLEGNKDHIYTSVAVLDALHKSDILPKHVMFYLVHDNNALIYPFGEKDSILTLPQNSNRIINFQTLYSYQVDKKTNIKKLVALEMMHDIRQIKIFSSNNILSAIKKYIPPTIKMLLYPNNKYDYDFYNFVRSNELFYVYDTSSIISMLDKELLNTAIHLTN